ncbi:hypothetical protein H5410_044881 [Solanum commersonii]|uniref:Uncharacterized protein n=1 Tax=Solanum commersonii TaxID=4109 RepID=A0A9J5X9W6_SOLCO|nr:hypothetical protein H5410_044881 [Solanum commersonii]
MTIRNQRLSLLKQPISSTLNQHLIDYPTPSNLSYWWGFGYHHHPSPPPKKKVSSPMYASNRVPKSSPVYVDNKEKMAPKDVH